MIHDEMRELQKYLTPPPTPLFKRETPLIIDEETRKKQEDEFVKNVIETCEKYGIKNAVVCIASLALLEKEWYGRMIAESKNEDKKVDRK